MRWRVSGGTGESCRATNLRSGFEGKNRGADFGGEIELESSYDTLETEEVVSVGGDFNFELMRFRFWMIRIRSRLSVCVYAR